MPIGETVAQQHTRMRAATHAICAATILEEELRSVGGNKRLDEIFLPSVLARITRISRKRRLDHATIGALLRREALAARDGDLAYLVWLTREIELCLTLHTSGLCRYLREKRSSLPKERRIALLYFGISLATDPTLRGKLVTYLVGGFIQGKEPSSEPDKGSSSRTLLTQSQRGVLDRLHDLADAYFSNEFPGPIRPRLFPLISGPTGAGKTFLVRKVAELCGAEFIAFTIGDWVPIGAQADYESSLYAILAKVANHDRVVLALDEIDKVRLDTDGTWGRSVTSDIWRALDLNFPIRGFLKYSRATLDPVEMSAEKLTAKIASSLWIVGAGTWQTEFEKKSPVGFAGATRTEPPILTSDTIIRSGTIPTELLMRFHPALLQVSYPTREETATIYRDCGLVDAASQVGLELTPADHNWTRGGMRSLETLWGEIAILRRKRQTKMLYEQ